MKTRSLFFSCLLSAVICQIASAQQDFRAGIKGGLNISGFRSEDVTNDYIAAGYHAGIFVRLPLTDHLSIQPEAQYSLKGARLNEAIGNHLSKADIRLEYIDAIALMNLKFAKIINLQGGLMMGILTDAGVRNKSGNPESVDLQQAVDQQELRLFDPGYALGVEVDILPVTAGFRYVRGLRNISGEIKYKGNEIDFPELRNTVYQVYLGLKLF